MALSGGWSLPAEAKDGGVDLAAGTLPDALAELAREARVSIGTDGALPHRATAPVRAATVADALAQLLRGTGLVARQVGPTAWRIERAAAQPRTSAPEPPPLPPPSTSAPVEETGPPIIVSATKRAMPLADAPYDVSVMPLASGQVLPTGTSTAWVARNSEGMTVAGAGPGRNRLFLRGVADSPFNGDSQSTVAVLLDDARLTYAAPDPDIRLIDMERVEVLKGPQGTLYGTGALGGIYRMVTRRADTGGSYGEATAGLDMLERGGLGQSGSVMVNLPLARDRLALRLVAYGSRDAGWVDSGSRRNGNSGTALGLRAGLGLDAGAWRFDATGFAQWLNSADTAYVLAPRQRSRPAQLAEPHDNDLRHLALRAERQGPFLLVLSSGVTWHEVIDRYDATQGAAGLGMAAPRLLSEDWAYRTIDSEVRLSGDWGRVQWLAGLSHVEARQAGERSLADATGTRLTLRDDRRGATETALFGEGRVPLIGALDLTVGGRLFRSHFENAWQLPVAGSLQRTRYGLTPSVSLSWTPRAGRLVYLRYGSALREGGVAHGAGGQVSSLESDELATLELGWREALLGGTLNLAAYHSEWENLQSDVLLGGGQIGTINAGNARISGADLAWSGPLARHTHVSLGGSVVAARLADMGSGPNLEDSRLPLVPRVALRASVEHDWALGPWQATARLAIHYAAGARLSFDPQLDVPLGEQVDSDAALHLRRGQLDMAVAVTNLLGSRADTLPFGNPLRIGLNRQFTPARPRSLSLQVQRRF